MPQEETATDIGTNTVEEDSFLMKGGDIMDTILSNAQIEIQTPSITSKSPDQNLDATASLSESTMIVETHSMTATSTLQNTPSSEKLYDCNVIESPMEVISTMKQSHGEEPANLQMDGIMPIEQTPNASIMEHPLLMKDSSVLTTPTTPSVPKERKRRIIIDDDDESPTFNPQRSNKKIRGKNRRNKNNLKKKAQLLSTPSSSIADKTNENVIFTSPEVVVSTSPSQYKNMLPHDGTFFYFKTLGIYLMAFSKYTDLLLLF